MSDKNINFISTDENSFNSKIKPSASYKYIPEWYKKTPVYGSQGVETAPTIKRCFPVLDAMSTGFIIPLESDIEVLGIKDGPKTFISHPKKLLSPVIKFDIEQAGEMPIDEIYCNNYLYKWSNHWIIKTPSEYMVLITHPLNRDDLPFKTFSAVVDTDKWETYIHIAFLMKKNFYGTIKKGTPIAQIIPIKREGWEAEFTLVSASDVFISDQKFKTKWEAGYRDDYRQPKKYK